MLVALDHVQLAAPAGSEPLLRAYYEGVLGMSEIPKPPVLAARGGCWFAAAGGAVQVHVGVEHAPAGGGKCHCRPARKAHAGLRVRDIDDLAARVARYGGAVVWDDNLPGHRRFYSEDPVGNRLEFLEPVAPHEPDGQGAPEGPDASPEPAGPVR
ncbi:glyoxalase [Streptomyces sp. NPDC048717]|uniref:glyoxalase n=1 Tax=unclassified Streptomyces TaxID=2593676 RepID=UPI0034199A58